MPKRKTFILSATIIIFAALALAISIWESKYALTSLLIALGTVLLFLASFEKKDVAAEKIVLIALLSALAAAGRVLFAALPSIQPVSFIVIMTGIVFGPEMGFMTGAVTALASNMLLGQGPWTPWQMFFWGMMGLGAGLLSRQLKKYPFWRIAYGTLWGFIFGWGMNAWFIFGGYLGDISLSAFIASGITSFYMDLGHALSNLLLILFLGKPFIKILGRIAVKYGLNAKKNTKT